MHISGRCGRHAHRLDSQLLAQSRCESAASQLSATKPTSANTCISLTSSPILTTRDSFTQLCVVYLSDQSKVNIRTTR